MALVANAHSIDRAMVQGWVDEYYEEDRPDSLEWWIRGQVDALELEDPMVNTSGHDNLPDETHIADMIVADLPSYGTGS